jgi:hypothetical protein
MSAQGPFSEGNRASWWRAQRNAFGLPDSLYAPVPFAVVLVVALGAGSGFLGLYPGVNTHTATLSGEGAPWIGLIVLLAVAGLWYWRVLHNGYALQAMALIVAGAVIVDLLVNSLALDVLATEEPDAFIGGLGLALLLGGLLLFLGLLFEGFVPSVLMGALMGLFLGGLAGFPVGLTAMLIMAVIYGPIGALAAGFGGLLRLVLTRFRR